MNTKILTTLELKKKIKVIYHELTKKGLIIDYTLNDKEYSIEADQLQSCTLLKEAGLINRFGPSPDGIILTYDTELNTSDNSGNHVQQIRNHLCSFEYYVLSTTFSQYDAICIAANHARNNQEKEMVEKISAESRKAHSKKFQTI